MKINPHSIGFRLSAAVLAFSLFITLISTGVQYSLYCRQARQDLEDHFSEIREGHLPGITSELWVMDKTQLKVQVDALLNLGGIVRAVVLENGKEVVSSGQAAANGLEVKEFPLNYIKGGQSRELGVLRISASLQSITKDFSREQGVVLVYQTAEIFFIAIFILIIFQLFVTRHLARVADYVSSLDPHNPTEPLKLIRRQKISTQPDELDMVVNSINFMQDSLHQVFHDLDQGKKEWEGTFEALEDMVVILDNQRRLVRLNQAASRFLGEQTDNPIGSFCHQLFCGRSSSCQECPVVRTVADNMPHTVEIENQPLGKFFHISTSPIFDDSGRLRNVVHLSRDITASRKLERQLRQAQKMEAMGTLAGGIAHDFNNILTPILGYTEIMMQQMDRNSPPYTYLGQVYSAGQRARELVKQILSFSRQTEQKRKPMNIAYVIKEALKLLRASIPSTIEISNTILADEATVLADPTQIHQVLMNLCTNAYHAMRESGGVLTVSLTTMSIGNDNGTPDLPIGNYVALEVSDTGFGMDTATRERIFEPYFTTKGVGEGTGLGLAIVHGIVKAMGGYILVESEPGKGSSFRVVIPQLEEEISLSSPMVETPTGGSERILVVDDEAGIAELHSAILMSIGYKVTIFAGSREALEIFQRDPDQFDLVLTDMAMPSMNGVELTKRLLAIRPGLPVVLCTGYSELIDEEEAKGMGFSDFIMKPVGMKELAACVRKALDEAGREL